MVSEIKIDDNFPNFFFNRLFLSIPFHSDRDANRGEIMLHVRENIIENFVATENA